VAWGANQTSQCNVPAGNDFLAIAAGYYPIDARKAVLTARNKNRTHQD
jgi:hypothetical protein